MQGHRTDTYLSIYRDLTLYFAHKVTENPYKYDHAGHTHDVCEIVYVKSGEVSYTARGKTYKINSHDLIISRPTDVHAIKFEGNALYDRYDLLYDEKLLPFNIYSRLPADLDVVNIKDHAIMRELFNKMDLYCERLSGDELRSMLSNLTVELFFNLMLDAKTTHIYEYSIENPTVARAMAYIDANITTLRNLDELCSALYITKSYLHHLFMEHMKISPKKYIISKLLEMAERDLSLGMRPTEVYLRCGFSDYSAFFRAYKSQFGTAPSNTRPSAYKTVTREDLLHNDDD